MHGRTPIVRWLAILWATLQLVSPAASALSDGWMAGRMSGDRQAHVEEATGAKCAWVHAPDCAVCRYLTSAASGPEPQHVAIAPESSCPSPSTRVDAAIATTAVLPDGRAPPLS